MSRLKVPQQHLRVRILLFTSVILALALSFGCGGVSGPRSSNGGGTPSPSPTPSTPTPSPSVSGENLYLADSLDFTIGAYKVDLNSGALNLVSNPAVPTPGAPFTVGSITLATLGGFLFAPGVDPNTPSGITTFTIDSSNGALTQVPTKWNGTANQTFAFEYVVADAAKNLIYAEGSFNMPIPNGSAGGTVLAALSVGADGTLTMLPGSIENGNNGSLSLDSAGRFLYVFVNQSQVFVYTRIADGTIGPQVTGSPFSVGPMPNFTSPFDVPNACFFQDVQPAIAVSSSGNVMYLSCTNDAEVKAFSVAQSGALTPLQSLALPDQTSEISALALDPTGKFLIGTQEEKNQVVVWSIDPNSGMLTQVGTTPAGTRPNWVVVDATGKLVYVSNGSSNIFKANFFPGSNNISEYLLDSSGTLTQIPGSPVSTGQGRAA